MNAAFNSMEAKGSGAVANLWLIAGGWLSLAAAAIHLGAIVGGPAWYRFFGAGEGLARAAERGEWMPHLMALAIAAFLAVWAAYAFAGAGKLRRLPLMRTALVAISTVYLLRGLILLPILATHGRATDAFTIWSSLIVLVYGLCYAVGTWRAWPYLSKRKASHALGS